MNPQDTHDRWHPGESEAFIRDAAKRVSEDFAVSRTYGHILRTPMEEIRRKPDGEPRWCFVCRARRQFEHVVTAPIVEPPTPGEEDAYVFPTGAYYGPTHAIECATCHTTDGDLFPGREREWLE